MALALAPNSLNGAKCWRLPKPLTREPGKGQGSHGVRQKAAKLLGHNVMMVVTGLIDSRPA